MRADLPAPHLVCQSIHAAISSTLAYGSSRLTHPHLVVVTVPDEQSLEQEFERLKQLGVRCCAYREPDFLNAMTAVATAPLIGPDRQPLRHLPLWKGV